MQTQKITEAISAEKTNPAALQKRAFGPKVQKEDFSEVGKMPVQKFTGSISAGRKRPGE